MTQSTVSIATLAPVPDEPMYFSGPSLPPAPPQLAQGATGLGPLPGASLSVSTLPQRYLLVALVPVVLGVLFTLISLLVRWPGVQ
jgi:hypothetical protein